MGTSARPEPSGASRGTATAVDSRRVYPDRVPILGQLQGEIMVFQPMTIREVSRGGAELETGFPLQLNSLHELRLTLGDRSVVVKGRVAHCSISDVEQESITYRSGVEFVEPSERVSAVIAQFVDALEKRRGS